MQTEILHEKGHSESVPMMFTELHFVDQLDKDKFDAALKVRLVFVFQFSDESERNQLGNGEQFFFVFRNWR